MGESDTRQPRVWLSVGGVQYQLRRMEGREWVSRPFVYTAEVPVRRHWYLPSRGALIGAHAEISWDYGRFGANRVAGVITRFESGDTPGTGEPYFSVTLEPMLAQLAHDIDTRLYSRVDVEQQVSALLEAAGYEGRYEWRRRFEAPERSAVLQAGESTLTFMQRLLARAGIFYTWVTEDDAAPPLTSSSEKLLLTDHPAEMPLRRDPITLPVGPMPQPGEYGLDRYSFSVRQYEPPEPVVAHGYRDRVEAEHLERMRRERARAMQYRFRASGPQADLAAGTRFRPTGLTGPLQSAAHAPWEVWHMVTSVERVFRLEKHGDERIPVYSTWVEAVPEARGETPLWYRPPEPEVVERPLVMSARVVGTASGGGRRRGPVAAHASPLSMPGHPARI